MFSRIRSSLFFKIYVTLLASLALVAVASAIFVRFGQDERERGWEARRDAFIAAMVPADASPDELRFALRRLSVAFDASISIFGRDGEVIARAGPPIPPHLLEGRGRGRDGRLFVAELEDGRTVAARLNRTPGPSARGPLLWLALIAAVIGVAAYPVVRHLTRRLEALKQGAATWGDGAKLKRLPVDGRDEVASVAASFNAAAERIERMVEAHRALLANASHELRSPLARLRMAIDLYEASPREATKTEIVQNLAELDALVEEILLASRLDHVEELDMREPIDLLALTTEEGARNGVSVSGETVQLHGDPRLLTRLVRNLMQNALRHGAPPVEATVGLREGAPTLVVSDRGAGISDADRAQVFEPFFRPAGRSETAGGWGLGLSLVRQIARHHGATVEIETPEGGGTAFVVRFAQAS